MRCCSFWMNCRRSCLSLSVSLSRSAWSIVEASMAASVDACLCSDLLLFGTYGELGRCCEAWGLVKTSDAQNLYCRLCAI